VVVMADDSYDTRQLKILLLLHGMESRYGKKTPKQVEAETSGQGGPSSNSRSARAMNGGYSSGRFSGSDRTQLLCPYRPATLSRFATRSTVVR
jgi:hypothetical protein